MANGKDGSGKGDPKSGNKPGGSGFDPKKPTPIIDLKATEVKPPKDDGKTAAAEAKPGAAAPAGDTKPTDTKASVPQSAGARSGSVPTAGPSDADKAKDAASKDKSTGEAADGKGRTASTTGSGGGSGNGAPDRGKAAVAPSPPRRSGGSIGGLLTHLVAGVAGGAIVLFAAKPIERELGMEFMPRAELPADLGARLAALEQRPSAQTQTVDTSALNARLEEFQSKLAAIEELRGKVDELASRQQTAAAPAPAGSRDAQPSADTSEIAQRIAKVEATLETLSAATGSNGQPSDVARFAAVSGKISDIETSLNNQLEALRKNVAKELEERLTKTAAVSAEAQAGTKRIDRELATMKTTAARLEQRAETIKAAQDSLDQAVRVAREEAAKLRVELDGLKGDITQQFKSVARPEDVKTAVAPVTSKIEDIESKLASILDSETARKENAKRIVMALELGNLKRVLNRGSAYAAELQEVKKLTGDAVDLSTLEKFQSAGVPTVAELQREFSKLAYAIIRSAERPEGETLMDRLLGGAKSLVQVRRADLPASDTSVEATVARIEKNLKAGNLPAAMEQASKLPKPAMEPAQPWLERVAARAEVDRAITDIEDKLKSSLGSSAGTKG